MYLNYAARIFKNCRNPSVINECDRTYEFRLEASLFLKLIGCELKLLGYAVANPTYETSKSHRTSYLTIYYRYCFFLRG